MRFPAFCGRSWIWPGSRPFQAGWCGIAAPGSAGEDAAPRGSGGSRPGGWPQADTPAAVALGVTEQLPESERHLYPQSYLTDSLAVRLGGRAGEMVVLGEPSTGASNDLAGATDLATRMVREWGFSAELGPVGYGPEGPSRDNPFAGRPYAEQTQRSIDQEVARLLREAEARATELLREHRDTLDRVIQLLLDRETIDGSELAAIAGVPERKAEQEQIWAPRAVAMTPTLADCGGTSPASGAGALGSR